jgi:carbamoyl-phosphate synthase large subunit
MKELVELEQEILQHRGKMPPDDLLRPREEGRFRRPLPGQVVGLAESPDPPAAPAAGRGARLARGAGQRCRERRYYYSSFNAPGEVEVSDRRKIMVLGGGPNRIGQGIEFDYCCVHAALAIRDEGFESIMVNCNPETVSTDYDTSDRLYFEPLTLEDVLAIYEREKPEGVIVQFGGQTPLNLARELAEAGVKILGTSHESIEMAEDRDRFNHMMRKLGIPQPESGMASTFDGVCDRRPDRLSADDPPVLRAGRPSDGSDPRRRGTGALSGCRRRGLAGSPRAAR